ncbi:MAG: hypothetical protein J2P30_22840 [Actinobacteria bacterium]|nr:hypothetical protein [Actinomycetota bacterium]
MAQTAADGRLPAAEAITRIMLRPLGRRGRARSSLEGGLGRQIEQAEREPGVRRQL